MKVLLIGRHQPHPMTDNGENVEVISQRDITWPATSGECYDMLLPLSNEMYEMGADRVLFQAMPTQLAVAISDWKTELDVPSAPFGAIVNKPGERLAGVERFFASDDPDEMKNAILFANPRAQISLVEAPEPVTGVIVRVDPPMRFEFSHIEWF